MTVDDEGALADVGFEDLACLSLREGDVVAIHFAFAGDFADCHGYFSFTVLTIALKASGWLTARSARTLRSRLMPFCFIPAMSWE